MFLNLECKTIERMLEILEEQGYLVTRDINTHLLGTGRVTNIRTAGNKKICGFRVLAYGQGYDFGLYKAYFAPGNNEWPAITAQGISVGVGNKNLNFVFSNNGRDIRIGLKDFDELCEIIEWAIK